MKLWTEVSFCFAKMLTRRQREEIDIAVQLEEPLTSDCCCKLITELIKYLLYQKQQIPVTFEYLVQHQSSSKASDGCLTTAKTTLSYLESISSELNLELSRQYSVVKEIAISMGATLLSPKLCVRVTLPPNILSNGKHILQQHSARKPLLNLMRSMLDSEEFQKAMTVPLIPTNTFVLVKKIDQNYVSKYFLPKPRYMLPAQTNSRFHIKLYHEDDCISSCKCDNMVSVYHDSSNSGSTNCEGLNENETGESNNCETTTSYQWYQSRDVIKGFKHVR